MGQHKLTLPAQTFCSGLRSAGSRRTSGEEQQHKEAAISGQATTGTIAGMSGSARRLERPARAGRKGSRFSKQPRSSQRGLSNFEGLTDRCIRVSGYSCQQSYHRSALCSYIGYTVLCTLQCTAYYTLWQEHVNVIHSLSAAERLKMQLHGRPMRMDSCV